MTRHWKNDEGASLILVIIFVMIFAIVIAAVLDFASTGFKTTEEVVNIRNQQHSVDGAMDGAINMLRRTGFGTDQNPCPDYTYNSTTDGDPTVVVKCTIDATSGGGLPSDQVPEYAILTGLWREPTATCDGFLQTGNDEMAVRGGIFSNGRIAINEFESGSGCGALSGTGEMVIAWGHAFAVGKCTWWKTVARPDPKIIPLFGTRACNGDTGAPTAKEAVPDYDPNYDTADAVATAPGGGGYPAAEGYDPLPDCTSLKAVTFHPGVYTEIPTHHYRRAGCPATADVWYFEPGTYYFDFPEDDALWNINPHNIIGGTLTDSLTNIANSWNLTTDRHVCDEDPYTVAPGVQFIFGGPSRIATQSNALGTSGVINLCAAESPTLAPAMRQRLVVYALQPGQDNRPDPVEDGDDGSELENKTAPANPPSTFDSPGNARSADNARATKSFTASGSDSESVTFDDFADVPAGSTVTSVQLEVHHAEGGGEPDKLKKSVALTYPSGTTTIDLDANNNGCTTSNGTGGDDVESCDLDFLEDPFLWKEINGLSAIYTVDASDLATNVVCAPGRPPRVCSTVDETADASLNSIVIKVEYRAPGFEPHDGDAQPFLTTTSNPVALFEGTFFAPYDDLAINVHNAGTTEFARGVIANHIEGQASASSKQTTAPFRLPDAVTEQAVILTAYVDDRPRLRARVGFEDGDGLFGRLVHIRDWVVVRG